MEKTVSSDDVRNILGAASFEKVTKVILVITSIFSDDRRKMEENDPGLELIDYKRLQKL
ncbi:restriction endonuclease [Enterococcus faecalis]